MKLSDFRVLTFDCYGTLIDWESGIYAALQPLLRKAVQATARRCRATPRWKPSHAMRRPRKNRRRR